jgi:DNA-binding NarL/FixJ family response regulator
MSAQAFAMTQSRILLVDDHDRSLDSLRALLEIQLGLEVVGEARDGKEAVRLAKALKPDLVIMDIGMPNMNGIDATRHIVGHDPDVKVLCHSMHAERRFVRAALEAGALGYLVKSCSFNELKAAIQEVSAGRAYLSSDILPV